MRYFLSFAAILCLLSFQLLGCGEDTEHPTTETPEGVAVNPNIVEPQIPLTPEAVFQQLQDEFAGRLENPGNFEGLRAATTSPIYLDYLAEAFPIAERVQSLEAYFQAAPPDPERYTEFLEAWVGVADANEIVLIYRITTAYREVKFVMFKLAQSAEDEEHKGIGDRWAANPELTQDVETATKTLVEILWGPDVVAFVARRELQWRFDGLVSSLETLAFETQKADAMWLHAQMEMHGTDAGLLWVAIHSPALIGEILYNFNETAVFLQWVEATRTAEIDEARLF